VNVRVIAATNRDLRALAEAGQFRPDLYYRLAVFTIPLPPLRDRGDDVELLARHFVRRYAAEYDRDIRDIAPEALALLRSYSWPGNVRELQSAIKQAIVQSRGPVLLARFLAGVLAPAAPEPAAPAGHAAWVTAFAQARLTAGTHDLHGETIREIERTLLPFVLEQTRGNQLRAAELLGLSSKTLRQKLRDAGLAPMSKSPRVKGSDTESSAE
jgi:two-component system nitrogen regulation response regulator GlnG